MKQLAIEETGIGARRVHRALMIACTASKAATPGIPRDLYTGVTWSTWAKHYPSSGLPGHWSLWALSAAYGLVPSWRTIEPYDRRLCAADVPVLATAVAEQWRVHVEGLSRSVEYTALGYELAGVEVAVVGGELYQELAEAAGLPVVIRIDGAGGGIGMLRKRFARWAEHVRHDVNVYPGDARGAWDAAKRPVAEAA